MTRRPAWVLLPMLGVLASASGVHAIAGPAGIVVDKPVALPGGANTNEPSISIDRKGAIYVSAPGGLGRGRNSPAWKSTDNGRSFTSLHPTSVATQDTALGGGDTDVLVDPRGYVYVTDLWLGDDSISVSKDGGATWMGSPVSHRPADDRNWLAYSKKDNALYQVYDGLDGVWVSRADLGPDGDTNQALVMANNYPVTTRPGYVSPPGRIAVDQSTGRLYTCFDHNDSRLDCATSTDKGASWTVKPMPDTKGVGSGILPDVAVDSAGTVYVTWRQSHDVRLAASYDHGATWRTRTVAANGQFPTLAVLGTGRIAVAWMQRDDDGFSVRYAEYPHFATSARSDRATVDAQIFGGASLARELGDFFRMAPAPNGDLFVTYTSAFPKAATNVVRIRRHS